MKVIDNCQAKRGVIAAAFFNHSLSVTGGYEDCRFTMYRKEVMSASIRKLPSLVSKPLFTHKQEMNLKHIKQYFIKKVMRTLFMLNH